MWNYTIALKYDSNQHLPVYIEKFLMATKLELDPIPKARKSVKDVIEIDTPLVAIANDIRSLMSVSDPSGLISGASAKPDSKIKTSSRPIPICTARQGSK